jgi:RNA polymerase sigma-70 factor, ECF subfamily
MDRDTSSPPAATDPRFDAAWRDERGALVGLATRMLGDRAGAEDVVQEAFGRFAVAPIDDIDDVGRWLSVVVRRICLNRLSSAYARREAVGDVATVADQVGAVAGDGDPADRVTLDDQVRLALGVVLDRLSPAERTAFVLHDVFGFPFDAIGEIVGRSPTACRQLASRARRAIRADAAPRRRAASSSTADELAARFIAACAGGDLAALMAVLDPDVVGEATLLGHGPLDRSEGALEVATKVLRLFGPGTSSVLVPVAVEGRPGIVATRNGMVVAIAFDERDGLVHHIRSFVRRGRPG